ncbi:hypothetical protein Kpol_2001p32 [Vanderwaltozyma polyspora DSM 70294]|uniref:rRNA-processing protein EBP2 n=1 Tax=Vanderwaltozyma polyspora (strain ATCC 22028 / DSM 70294 / BCRC 21397 / CBS 2163 / NBRC 10782 / NRRL Y-8283 / UCD 57-17) TaxID=436907 RepID=A7TGR4_VANPO|nr:uncharacterized protein Kpol_2001p32 [Vanderwaltozyma polyspora DSM 70294]EDO18527.1 hypothetical protein Kpol_2001p32 [Vanderwaltozyma polyspora DSM 70294]
MAKGFKLKELLAHQKDQEKMDKAEKVKKSKQAKQMESEEPTVVTADDVVAADAADANIESESNGAEEEYKSQALSKKDKRKLKKQQMKEEQEQNEEDEEEETLDLNRLAESASESDDSEDEDEDEDEDEEIEKEDNDEEEEEEAEAEAEDVPLSDVEFDSDADIVPHQKLTINNTRAIKDSLERIQLPWKKHSFQEHQSITSEANADEGIKDIYDDTERELAFYKQSLNAVLEARDHLKRLKVPFKRPLDYFAEMVKSDEHMDKIKGKLVQEASEKKAREDARKQRQLKKFGKQVQVATLQKRQAEKRETLDKIKSLKKKRKHNEISNDDFDVGVEEAAAVEKKGPNAKRAAKNSKYGQGGMKRFKRKNDADSSMDVTGFSQRKMKGKPSRPGKSKRSRRH